MHRSAIAVDTSTPAYLNHREKSVLVRRTEAKNRGTSERKPTECSIRVYPLTRESRFFVSFERDGACQVEFLWGGLLRRRLLQQVPGASRCTHAGDVIRTSGAGLFRLRNPTTVT